MNELFEADFGPGLFSMIELFRKHLYDQGQKQVLSRFDALRDAHNYLELNDNMKKNMSGSAFMK